MLKILFPLLVRSLWCFPDLFMSESRERRGTAVAANETKKTKSFFIQNGSLEYTTYTRTRIQ